MDTNVLDTMYWILICIVHYINISSPIIFFFLVICIILWAFLLCFHLFAKKCMEHFMMQSVPKIFFAVLLPIKLLVASALFFFLRSFKCICNSLFSMIRNFVTVFTKELTDISSNIFILILAENKNPLPLSKYSVYRFSWISHFIYCRSINN